MPRSRPLNRRWSTALASAATGALLAGVLVAPQAASAGDGLPPTPAVLVPVPVLGATAPAPTTAGLAIALDPLVRALGDQTSAVVIDPATGQVLYERAGGTPRIPASTTKVLTALGVLSALGAGTRIATTVVSGSAPGTIVLVGGGDPSLTRVSDPATGRPSLEALAQSVLPALVGPVRLEYDASLFGGPTIAPGWGQEMVDTGFVAPVTALAVDEGRVSPDSDQRVADPPLAAAEAFAALLRDAGAEVTDVVAGQAPENATELARVESAPVAALVTSMLSDSDNDAAEMLAHLAGAKATGLGTFESGSAATIAALTSLDLPADGVRLVDASGLSSGNTIPARTLAQLLALVAGPDHADVTYPIGPGLAVAGFSGTLADRFVDMPTAAGVVRAKTGTLDGVTALAGTLRDADGRVLVFAVIANGVSDIYSARYYLDEFATTLVGCGCN